MTKKRFLYVILIVIPVVFSFVTLNRMPPVNSDEIENLIFGHQKLNTNKINHPWTNDVIHPYFECLAGATQGAIRGTYISIVAIASFFCGKNILFHRFMSFLTWLMIGLLLCGIIKFTFSRQESCIAGFLYVYSFQGFLASHLVRPDIYLALAAVVSFLLIVKNAQKQNAFYCAMGGILSVLGMGLHPHGLVFFPLFLMACFIIPKNGRYSFLKNYLIGAMAGVVVFLFLADIPAFVLEQNAYTSALYKIKSKIWIERLVPWNLAGDAVLSLIRPESYYIDKAFQHPAFWPLAGLSSFYVFCLSFFWCVCSAQKNKWMTLFLFFPLFFFILIGYGHFRREFLYNLPVSLFTIPLTCFCLADTYKIMTNSELLTEDFFHARFIQKMIYAAVFILLLAVMFLLFHSLMAFFMLSVFICFLKGRGSKFILFLFSLGLFVIFSLYCRAPGVIAQYHKTLFQNIFSIHGILILLLFSAFLVFIILSKKTKQKLRNEKTLLSAVLTFLFLALCLGFDLTSSFYHVITISSQTPSIHAYLKKPRNIVKESDAKILAPPLLWLNYGQNFRDSYGLVADYFYSGIKRPWENIKRYQPDYIVIDDRLRRRFLLERRPSSNGWKLLPDSQLLKTSYSHLGSIEASPHHSGMDFYQLFWPDQANEHPRRNNQQFVPPVGKKSTIYQ